ncbi:hypothetical protein HYG81_21805 (plasmid) [Natrinema zhouii]|uniref:hypothetical protein n=1 Tax=Natrinema zhouii TaxID=1710539 RepID=UPI001CFF65E0|nr:hypothetical protein [Natrinema zhouii]UHQ98615.1 hypothetical protein HYG81_21805 [Natrinema zhouii]
MHHTTDLLPRTRRERNRPETNRHLAPAIARAESALLACYESAGATTRAATNTTTTRPEGNR